MKNKNENDEESGSQEEESSQKSKEIDLQEEEEEEEEEEIIDLNEDDDNEEVIKPESKSNQSPQKMSQPNETQYIQGEDFDLNTVNIGKINLIKIRFQRRISFESSLKITNCLIRLKLIKKNHHHLKKLT